MASSSTPSSSSYSSPCAACKFLRRKCIPGCIFAPFFPPEEPEKFANVHKIFGASNVTKLLNDLLPHQREDAVNSLAYEAEARVRDPVYGCVGAISYLQRQVHRLQKELDAANADLIRFACSNNSSAVVAATQGLMAIETATVATSSGVPPPAAPPPIAVRPAGMEYNRVGVHVPVPYSGSFGIPTSSGIMLWHDGSLESKSNMGDGGGNM